MNILVVGGAGYIGSHTVAELLERGHRVTVLDNLSTGHRDLVLNAEFVEGEMHNHSLLYNLLIQQEIDTVMHFAALSLVGESVKKPDLYYQNNVIYTKILLDTMIKAGVKKMVFSSTCSIYGYPKANPIDETHPVSPINPYGHTKLGIEWMLHDYHRAYGLDSVSLRYFNAAGAHSTQPIGEDHHPETHLIPRCFMILLGHFPHLEVFGNDYSTPDGTCIRDYIHVEDIARAHALALPYLDQHLGAHHFNVGIGKGFSVMEIIKAVKTVSGRTLPFEMKPRREGDPSELVAQAEKIRKALGWEPKFTDIQPILSSAWAWHQKRHKR